MKTLYSIVLVLVFILLHFQLIKLFIQIERASNNEEYLGNWLEIFKKGFQGRQSSLWLFPFFIFLEESDSSKVKGLKIKRNLFILLFWLLLGFAFWSIKNGIV